MKYYSITRFYQALLYLVVCVFFLDAIAIAGPVEKEKTISAVVKTNPKAHKLLDSAKYDKLLSKIESHGAARIIVRLDSSEEPMLAKKIKHRLTRAMLTKRKVAISRLQNRFMNSVDKQAIGKYKKFKHIAGMAFKVNRGMLDQLLNMPEVTSIEEDKLFRPSLGQSIPLIGADQVWSDGFTGQGQAVAILDTGVDKSHSFLAGKVVAEACFSDPDGNSLNGSASLCPSGNGEYNGAGVNCTGISGCDHGTHVAGIAAGNGLNSGVGEDAKIIAIQVFTRFGSDMGAYTSDIILGLEKVLDLHFSTTFTYNIASANLSLGGGLYNSIKACDLDNPSTKLAIDNLRAVGIATVIASGNDGSTTQITAPGCISSAISVGATNDSDLVAGFSNAATWLSMLAPGVSINSSEPNGNFGNKSGTSMATPHIAGAWAVLKSKVPSATVDQILAAMNTTGVPVTDPGNNITFLRIDLVAASDALDDLAAGGLPPVNLILDNDSAGIITSGAFLDVTDSGSYGGTAKQTNGPGIDSFRFVPDLPHAGPYLVYAWWSESPSLSSNVDYDIAYSGGVDTIVVNQQINGSQWNELGIFDFAADGAAYVEISDINGGISTVDAVRFEFLQSLETPPSVTMTANVPSPQKEGTSVTFTAEGSGGSGIHEYRFRLLDLSGGDTVVQPYSSANSWVWDTSGYAGNSRVIVWIRNVGSTAPWEDYAFIDYTVTSTSAIPDVAMTANVPSPQTEGTSVTVTAEGSGGSGNYEYRFRLLDPSGGDTVVQPYSSANSWVWDTSGYAGSSRVIVWIRNLGSTASWEDYAFIDYTVTSTSAIPDVTMTANVPSPQTEGTSVTVTAEGGGSGNYEYRFRLIDPSGGDTVVQPYSSANSWVWDTNGYVGNSRVIVWIRNVGSTAPWEDYAFIDYTVTSTSAIPDVSMTANVLSPQTEGTSVTFTAEGSGGSGTYEYRFRLLDPSGGDTVVQPYSSANGWVWDTSGYVGNSRVIVWIRNVGSTAPWEDYAFIDYLIEIPE